MLPHQPRDASLGVSHVKLPWKFEAKNISTNNIRAFYCMLYDVHCRTCQVTSTFHSSTEILVRMLVMMRLVLSFFCTLKAQFSWFLDQSNVLLKRCRWEEGGRDVGFGFSGSS